MERQEVVKIVWICAVIIPFLVGWFLNNQYHKKKRKNQTQPVSAFVPVAQSNTSQEPVDFEQEEYARISSRNKKLFWSVVAIVYSSLLGIGVFYGEIAKFGEYSLQAWVPIVAVLCLYTSVSFITQDANKVGAKFLFGGLLYETSPGLIFIPIGFCTHDSETITVIQKELPTDVPKLYGKEEDGVTAVKYIRMTTGFPEIMESKVVTAKEDGKKPFDPLQSGRLTFNTLITVSFSVSSKPGAYFQYFKRMQSTDNFLQIADDVAVGYVRKEVMNKTPSSVYKDWKTIESDATDRLKESVKGYGVEDVRITVKEFGLTRDINESLANITIAQATVAQERLAGEAEKEKNLLQAVGIRALKKAELEGPFEALKEAIQNLGFTKEQALFLANQEAVAKMYEKAKYSIVPSGKGGFMDQAAFMAVMQEAIQASSTHQNKNNQQPNNTPQRRNP